MKSSWRTRPTGSWFARLWRPWVNLNPFSGRGRRINERPSVGIRDLVASPDEVEVRPERRWAVIGGFFAILLVLLVGRLFLLQITGHASSVAAVQANSLRQSTIPAPRGMILDRSGQPLVNNIETTEIRLSQAEAALHPSVEGALALLLGTSIHKIDVAVHNLQYGPYQPAPVMDNVSASDLEFIRLHPGEFPGVTVVTVAKRNYPFGGTVAAQVLGYVGPITGAEIQSHPNQGYQTNSVIGKTGVELYYEQYLRGHDGTSSLEVNSQNQILGAVHTTPPKVGDSVVLNIDEGLQAALDHSLAADIARVRTTVDPVSHKIPPALNGAAMVVDVRNGHVLAMSSFPSFDLNSFTSGLSESEFKQLLNEGAFNNYAIQGLYTPGSTFKMITATAELQTKVFSASTVVDDNGVYKVPGCLQGYHGCLFHDDANTGAGHVNLAEALIKSSDYYFYNLGYLFWSQQAKYGQTPIQNVAAEYGLGKYTNIDLPNENVGRVDSPSVRIALHAAAPKAFPNYSWYTGDNIEMAFGQGSTALTPVELVDAYAAFANGGTVYAPEVAAAVINSANKVVVRYGSRVIGHVKLPPSVRDPILQGLIGVVNNPQGTAYGTFHSYANFNLNTFTIAGKTGTASNAPGLEPNSLFVGFGPAQQPKYAVICVIDQGGYGADAAAPVVAQAFNYLVAHPPAALSLRPNFHPTTTTTTGRKKTTSTKG